VADFLVVFFLTKELIPAFIESLWFTQFTQSHRKLPGIPAYKKDQKDNRSTANYG
jgi:hypothetical protein